VKVGQEFQREFSDNTDHIFDDQPWVKLSQDTYQLTGEGTHHVFSCPSFRDGCRVRIADCKPELDFDTWWEREGSAGYRSHAYNESPSIKELCRTAWENGADKANSNK
jgi:hypothetical protein